MPIRLIRAFIVLIEALCQALDAASRWTENGLYCSVFGGHEWGRGAFILGEGQVRPWCDRCGKRTLMSEEEWKPLQA